MNWTAKKQKAGVTNGEVFVPVVYTADSGEVANESYRTRKVTPDWPDALIRARLAELNTVDLSQLSEGDPKPAPVEVKPVPTQDELDQQNFLALLNDWKQKDAALKSGASKTATQQVVDDAYAAWKAVYKDEYAPFIVGLF